MCVKTMINARLKKINCAINEIKEINRLTTLVFSRPLIVRRKCPVHKSDGKLFHTRGHAAAKLLSSGGTTSFSTTDRFVLTKCSSRVRKIVPINWGIWTLEKSKLPHFSGLITWIKQNRLTFLGLTACTPYTTADVAPPLPRKKMRLRHTC